jgi:sensor domain CHASE-containing protein
MNLRIKVFLIVGGVLCALFFSVYNIFSRVLIADFRDLERRSVERDVSRAIDALTNRLDDLNIKVADWSQWDDTYEFVSNQNVDYLEANLQDSALQLLHIDFVVLIDQNEEIIFKKQIDKDGKEVLKGLITLFIKVPFKSLEYCQSMNPPLHLLNLY